MPEYTRSQLMAMTVSAARKYGIDEHVALAQINQESGFRTNVGSNQGAYGIAQFLEETGRRYGVTDRSDPKQSLEGWGKYMRHLLTRFNGDYRLALAGYHAGEGDAAAALKNPRGNPKTNHYVNVIMNASARIKEYVGAMPPRTSRAPVETAAPVVRVSSIPSTYRPDAEFRNFIILGVAFVLILLALSSFNK